MQLHQPRLGRNYPALSCMSTSPNARVFHHLHDTSYPGFPPNCMSRLPTFLIRGETGAASHNIGNPYEITMSRWVNLGFEWSSWKGLGTLLYQSSAIWRATEAFEAFQAHWADCSVNLSRQLPFVCILPTNIDLIIDSPEPLHLGKLATPQVHHRTPCSDGSLIANLTGHTGDGSTAWLATYWWICYMNITSNHIMLRKRKFLGCEHHGTIAAEKAF